MENTVKMQITGIVVRSMAGREKNNVSSYFEDDSGFPTASF